MKEKTLYRMFMFQLLYGFSIPRFEDFLYLYYTSPDYSNFSQLQYGIIRLSTIVGVLCGITAYNLFLKHTSIRAVIIVSQILYIIQTVGHILFVKRITFGLNPFVYAFVLEMTSESFLFAFNSMPLMSTVAKLIPHSVESTIFGFFTGLNILFMFVISKIIGNLINIYFKVDKESLDDLWKLYIVQILGIMVSMCFVWLLPTPAQVKRV